MADIRRLSVVAVAINKERSPMGPMGRCGSGRICQAEGNLSVAEAYGDLPFP